MAKKEQKKTLFDRIGEIVGLIIAISFIGFLLYSCAKPTYDPNDYNKDGVVDDNDREILQDDVEDMLEEEGINQ